MSNRFYINQFPDFEADRAAGKRNWVVRLGREQARPYFNYIILASFGMILLGIGLQQLPILTGLAGFALPLGFKAMHILQIHYQQKHQLIPAIQATIVLHSVVSLWLTFAFLLS
jgi:1,4-dihydroxy-2-naphthoate octaprenyltransferase